MLRPEAMKWVDLVIHSDSAATILEIVAASGYMELQKQSDVHFLELDPLHERRNQVRHLELSLGQFRDFLPPARSEETTVDERQLTITELLPDISKSISTWKTMAAPLIRTIQSLISEHEQLITLRQLIGKLPPDEIDLGLWCTYIADKRRYIPLVALLDNSETATFMDNQKAGRFRIYGDDADSDSESVIMGIVERDKIKPIEILFKQLQIKRINIPEWVRGTPSEALRAVTMEEQTKALEIKAARSRLQRINQESRIAGARWLIQRHRWLERIFEQTSRGENLVCIGGWVPDSLFSELVELLEASDYPFLVRLDDESKQNNPPSVLNNPAWVKKFEPFVRGFGMPGSDEVDPSLLLAILTPVMFGYMFGDVGQGLILILIGYLLRNYVPLLVMLVPAGISATLFGFLYGSVFSFEHVLPALWIQPMSEPLLILAIPLVFGTVIMFISLYLGFLESWWSGARLDWLQSESPMILTYLGVPVYLIKPEPGLILLGFAFAILLWRASNKADSLVKFFTNCLIEILELFEKWLQININTLSFSRLGAFALAHAGLSAAIISLAELTDSLVVTIMVLVTGNAFVLLLEGFVVSIQTTRLIMFEFYRRFFEGKGRTFNPLTLEEHPGISKGTGVDENSIGTRLVKTT
jgi:V/A-type H+/Na+-transporting ATPase subunit I